MITYKPGYKYQLVEDYSISIGLRQDADSDFLSLHDGVLTIKKGYAWDGPSGPTFDTPSFMRGSLVHDALYQLIREKHLPLSMRDFADSMLKDLCKEDGMPLWRRAYVWAAVHVFGAICIKEDGHPTLTAP